MAYRRGEETPSSKLTEEKVREIRASQETQVAIALRFGISTKQVRNIKSNRAWKHVK
jgi:tryptophan synthase alpha subunit